MAESLQRVEEPLEKSTQPIERKFDSSAGIDRAFVRHARYQDVQALSLRQTEMSTKIDTSNKRD